MQSLHETLGLVIKDYSGKPADYPIPASSELMLFYIQRNNTFNSVIFEINLDQGGIINLHDPMDIFWLYYHENGVIETLPINAIQRNLAYGYVFEVIQNDLIRFHFKVYPDISFFISKIDGQFKVTTKLKNDRMIVTNLYVHTEDLGIFPQVIFVEFFGKNLENNSDQYFKLTIQK
ncbi:MAG: DUF4833 domain-containing protein [Saprospiraceae bacterium]